MQHFLACTTFYGSLSLDHGALLCLFVKVNIQVCRGESKFKMVVVIVIQQSKV